MYSFINDLSISPNGITVPDNWSLINTVMDISYQLRDYRIERLRVPVAFTTLPIAGTSSLADYMADPHFDNEKKTLLYTFLGNRIEEPDSEISAALANAQNNKLINVYHNGNSSDLLTEAHVMNCVAISFETTPDYQVDLIAAELSVMSGNDDPVPFDVNIENLFNLNGFNVHSAFLIEWKRKIVFTKIRWNPINQPIWNDLTAATLTEINFPESISQKVDKKEELRRVGSLVAEMNAWVFDEAVTKKNKNAGQWRRIFRSDSGSKTAYLSIDFENAHGGFEVHNHKGTHQGQIDFLGVYNKNADPKGYHDIDVY